MSFESFDCGVPDLNLWLKNYARQNHRRNLSRTFVAMSVESGQVAGFYTLKMVEISDENRKIPAVLLARLGVDLSFQGQGIGGRMMLNALAQIAQTSEVLAFAFVVVDPKDCRGAGFYEKYGFKRLEIAQQRIYLDIRNLQKTLGVYA